MQSVNDSVVSKINSQIIEKKMKIFPNPVYDILNIEAENYNIVSVEILSSIGGSVYFKNYTNANKVTMDLSELVDGFYLLVIKTKDLESNFRFIKN